jgi:hypothetical protein
MAKEIYKTREEWLVAATDLLRPIFKARAEVKLPKNVRMACGFTSAGARGKRIGECWSRTASADDTFEMFIHPKLDDPVRVLGVLVHELVHAGVGIKEGHNKVFGKAARAMLLEGKLTATTEGDAFKKEIASVLLPKLGDYPHAALGGKGETTGPKKQKTRLLKVYCRHCDYCMRVTSKWLEIAIPQCPDNECKGSGEDMLVDY